MSTVKSKKLQVGTDASASNNFTIYQPSTPDGTLRIGVGNADSPTEVGRFNANGYKPQQPVTFFAWQSTQQTGISNGVLTKVNFDTESWDTNNNFASSRFTPTVAGYYQVNTHAIGGTNPTSSGTKILSIYKNGSRHRENTLNIASTSGSVTFGSVSSLIYLNGSTDYIEVYVYADGMPSTYNLAPVGADYRVNFSAHLISQA